MTCALSSSFFHSSCLFPFFCLCFLPVPLRASGPFHCCAFCLSSSSFFSCPFASFLFLSHCSFSFPLYSVSCPLFLFLSPSFCFLLPCPGFSHCCLLVSLPCPLILCAFPFLFLVPVSFSVSCSFPFPLLFPLQCFFLSASMSCSLPFVFGSFFLFLVLSFCLSIL